MLIRTKKLQFLLSIVALVAISTWTMALPSQQQEPEKQRPRRVGGNANTTSSGKPATTSPGTSDRPSSEEIDEGDVLRVETQLVSVPAIVTSSSGRPMGGLKREDFLVYEDGQKQSIATFGTTEAPIEIALLLDTSGSTRADMSLIREAANAFVNSLRPGDRIAIVAFGTMKDGPSKIAGVEVLSQLSENRNELRRAIESLGSSNGTPFYDALSDIVNEVFRDPPKAEFQGRRAIVALTDGVDSSSASNFESVRSKISQAGVSCYFVQVNTEDFVEDRLLKDCEDDGRLSLSPQQLERYRKIFVPRAGPNDFVDFCQMGQFERMQISRDLYNLARREMDDLARASGGKTFAADSLQDARAAFSRVATEIGTQYSLGYYPSNKARDGKFRKITVQVLGAQDSKVRAREGYYAPKG